MLPSRYRLKKKINFARAEIDGRLIQSKSFGLEIYDRKDDKNSRFAFVISTKISKKAVVRNKIKRLMSYFFEKRLNKIKNGLDIVFLVKPIIVELDKRQIENEINAIFTENLQK